MSKSSTNYVPLQGSARSLPPGNKVGVSDLNEIIQVIVRVRRRAPIEEYAKHSGKENKILSHAQHAKRFGAVPKEIEQVIAFAHDYNLTVAETSIGARSVVLKGSVKHFSAAFRVHLSNYQDEKGKIYRGRMGMIYVPKELEKIITGVFGLDSRSQVTPMSKLSTDQGGFLIAADDGTQTPYKPGDVATAYGYPTDADGTGQCIALIEFDGGYRSEDLDLYFTSLNMTTKPTVIPVSADKIAVNNPSDANSDGEVVLDIEVAGAIAPGAKIVVYFAQNTQQGFLAAISAALQDQDNQPSIISISWTSTESNWGGDLYQEMEQDFMTAKSMGITVLCATGDFGSSNKETDGLAHVGYPASSSFVLACGGTRLSATDEVTWNDNDGRGTGGGISQMTSTIPDYQQAVTLPPSVNPGATTGRGLPDIAGHASASPGYSTYIDGGWYISSGTSAVAPLVAGLLALANQKLGRRAGFIHDKLYQAPATAFKDITSGNNSVDSTPGYSAGPGWDACTGLGVPLGAIIQYL